MVPRRAMIVSAGIGEGHNSAGRALEEAMARAWPGCEVRWLDALAAMGPGFAPLARGFYVSQVRHLPWMYEFFFSAMWRHRWYLDAARRGAAGDKAAAQAGLGVDAGRFTVLVCAGSLGLGRVGRAVTALLEAGPDVQVIAVCGRNERLRRELAARGEPASRLRVLGWTDDMPGWMTASDVVVGNAGGATGLEAVASGRPVIMFEPIAGHGRANAALMADSGLAVLAWSPAELTDAVRRLADDPGAAEKLAGTALARARDRCLEQDLADLAAMAAR